MININTLGNSLKRGILSFSQKLSEGMSRPSQKFIASMIYGLISSRSCKLSEIGRALKEDIALKKTVERLGRNLADFSESEAFMENYLKAIRPSIGKDTMLLIDPSDVTKPCSPSMEAIGSVYDASRKQFGAGYWTLGVVALTEDHSHPIPVYEKLYPCKERGGDSKGERHTALEYLRERFDKDIPRIFDRGFDSGSLIHELIENEERFIIRQNQNRVAVHGGKRVKIDDIVRGLDCQHELRYKGKSGERISCKIGMTQILVPNMNQIRLNMVVCKGVGDPLVLYTNLDETLESIAVRVVKAYLMRWRIDEYYALKKQEMQFEDFRVRSLNAIRSLDLLLTAAIGYLAMLCSKVGTQMYVCDLISISKRIERYSVFVKKRKFFFYAILDGIANVLASLKRGISHFFEAQQYPTQLTLTGIDFLG